MIPGVVNWRTMALACALALSFVFHSSAFAAPRVTELGPEVTVGEPSGGFMGRLSVTPAHGPVGTPVTVSGEGLPADQEVQLIWTTVKGSWKVTIAEYLGDRKGVVEGMREGQGG